MLWMEEVDDQRRGAVFAARGAFTSATMLVAFWLQFGSAFFKATPAPVILFWLGIASIGSAVLTLWVIRRKRG